MWAFLFGCLVWAAGSRAIKPPVPGIENEPFGIPPGYIARIAGTQVETALAKLDTNRPDEALALMVSALDADPGATHARSLAERILRETVWNFPLFTLTHPLPVERIEYFPPSSLWVGLGSATNTLLRWNLDDLRIENVLFPLKETETRSLVIDPTQRRLVIERAGVTLLCDAKSLKPIRDLGLLPDFVTPPSVIVFSADGLLLAHPAFVSETDRSLVWHLREAASGEIIRSSEPYAADSPQPLAAFLERRALRILHADGALAEIPVSPVEAAHATPAAQPVKLLHARFGAGGHSALVLSDFGPHRPPALGMFPADAAADSSLEPTALLERFPWSRHPGIWSGLFRNSARAPLTVDGGILNLRDGSSAPLHAGSPITAVAASGRLRIVGLENGTLTFHRLLPLPLAVDPVSSDPSSTDPDAIAAFRNLSMTLTGIRHDEEPLAFNRIDAATRLQHFSECDFEALQRLFPSLDFGPVATEIRAISLRSPSADVMRPLQDRLDRTKPDLHGTTPASQFALALNADDPERIKECLNAAVNLPPLLHKLAVSRIAWLENRRGDALALWPDEFPDLAKVRLREDWDGWEKADFSAALEKIRANVAEELATLEVPENADAAQRLALFQRLTDPAALRSIGRQRLADATIKAALAFSAIPEEGEATFRLAEHARNLGAAPETCLRIEAHALAALGLHPQARDRWVLLLTEHAVETHEPGDYAEAAYTAFECADPAQAMEILNAGLQRFPKNPDFALRAGWIALLTGNSERAYRYLLAGREVGYPPEKLENATALLAIAAAQTGETTDASAFYQDLLDINPEWANPETIEALGWPEELKSTMRQLTW